MYEMAEASVEEKSDSGKSKNFSKGESFNLGRTLYMEETFSDVIITLSENGTVWRFPTHSIVLAARSVVFHKMLFGDFSENRTREVYLPDMKPGTMKKFLRYLYFDDTNFESWEEAVDLLKVAHKYLMEPLLQMCCQYVKEHVDLSNVYNIYRKTKLFNLINLDDFCLEVIHSAACIVLRSSEFEFLDEESVTAVISSPNLNVDSEMCVVSAVLRWAATQCCRQNKPLTDENVAHMMIPFFKYLNTVGLSTDELATLPRFIHASKNSFPRLSFVMSPHLEKHANHVNFKIMDFSCKYLSYDFEKTTIFTFLVDYSLFLIGINFMHNNKIYNDDFMIVYTKIANVTVTVFEYCLQKCSQEKYRDRAGKTTWETKVLLDAPVLLQTHTVYHLGLRSNSKYYVLNNSTTSKPNIILPKTEVVPIKGVSHPDAPFTIQADTFWGVSKLLYLNTPIPSMSYLK